MCNNCAGTCGGGIYGYGNVMYIMNNLIANNSLHGLRSDMSLFHLRNNTIVNNQGYGLYFVNEIFLRSHNDIIWGNLSGPFNPCLYVNYDAQYSIIQDTVMTDPLFAWPTTGVGLNYDALSADWSLTQGSPAINAGIPDTSGLGIPQYDLAGNLRIMHDTIDVGAFEYDGVIGVFTLPDKQELKIWPNPNDGKFTVMDEDFKHIEVINSKGQSILKSTDKNIDISTQPNATYYIKIFTESRVIEEKIIKNF